MDPSRAGPGSSNMEEQGEEEGNVLLAGSTGQFRVRKQHRVKCIKCHIWCLFHHLGLKSETEQKVTVVEATARREREMLISRL